jgi:serine/threonine protein kinase
VPDAIASPIIAALGGRSAGSSARQRAITAANVIGTCGAVSGRGGWVAWATAIAIARGGDEIGVTQIGALIGTPRYMAPEQLAGDEVDHRADLFALGVILYELATGARPWSGDNPIDGYFVVDHRYFLLEAKWRKLPVTASEVFAFQGKLRGKLLGTLGLFVSIGEFAADASSALVFGKAIDVLLADRGDVELALDPAHTFREMIRVKMRAAAQTGEVYYAYKRWLDLNP